MAYVWLHLSFSMAPLPLEIGTKGLQVAAPASGVVIDQSPATLRGQRLPSSVLQPENRSVAITLF